MASVNTKCITILMGTQGVHTHPLASWFTGNFDFWAGGVNWPAPASSFGQIFSVILNSPAYQIVNHSGYTTPYYTSSVGPPVAAGIEFVGAKGAQSGEFTSGVFNNSSLANRSVQWRVAHNHWLTGSHYEKTQYTQNNFTSHASQRPTFASANHYQSRFSYTRVHWGSGQGYGIDSENNLHLGATDSGGDQHHYFTLV